MTFNHKNVYHLAADISTVSSEDSFVLLSMLLNIHALMTDLRSVGIYSAIFTSYAANTVTRVCKIQHSNRCLFSSLMVNNRVH